MLWDMWHKTQGADLQHTSVYASENDMLTKTQTYTSNRKGINLLFGIENFLSPGQLKKKKSLDISTSVVNTSKENFTEVIAKF